MKLEIDLASNELAFLIHILHDRIIGAQQEGIPDDHSSSIF